MSDMLQNGVAWLGALMKAHCSRTVSYQRASQSVELVACLGRTIFRVSDGRGGEIRVQMTDWIVDAADLVLDGEVVEPEEGDCIVDGGGPAAAIYQVAAPPGDEPAWRTTDGYRARLRIHTELVT